MGNSWSGGPNECFKYWKDTNPNLEPESIRFWCSRWFKDNKDGKALPGAHQGPHGWGYPEPYYSDLPYIEEYESFNDVGAKYFGGRDLLSRQQCTIQTRKYYGLDVWEPSYVMDTYCYGSREKDLKDCGGFFENLGCAVEDVGGSFGSFFTGTIPQMIKNGLNAMGAGADFMAWFIANWPMILGVGAGLFLLGFAVWVFSKL